MDEIVTSFLIASSKPRELAEFYASVCNGMVSKGFNPNHYLIIYRQFYKIQIYKPSTKKKTSFNHFPIHALCFEKESNLEPMRKLKEWCDEIVLLGGEFLEEPRNEPFGAEAWMLDLERNCFLVLVPFLKAV